jgi:hypothetical protein
MSVNPNLETLMNLVDELQDQMPEGKYLEAMNALRDLHAGRVPPRQPPAFVVPEGRIRLTPAEIRRYEEMRTRRRLAITLQSPVVTAYRECKFLRDACDEVNVTMMQWYAMEYEERLPVIQRTLELSFEVEKKRYRESKNPRLDVCPFISRHAIGRWYDPTKPYQDSWRGKWDCVCGSKNILCKNWKQHEVSDKHQVWAKSRAVTKAKAKSMREKRGVGVATGFIHVRHMCGHRVTWTQQYENFAPQDRNEWSHPELFAGKPLDWLPPTPENARLVPTYEIDPNESDLAIRRANYGRVVQGTELPPLPPNTYHNTSTVSWSDAPQTLTEEGYAMFISMEE